MERSNQFWMKPHSGESETSRVHVCFKLSYFFFFLKQIVNFVSFLWRSFLIWPFTVGFSLDLYPVNMRRCTLIYYMTQKYYNPYDVTYKTQRRRKRKIWREKWKKVDKQELTLKDWSNKKLDLFLRSKFIDCLKFSEKWKKIIFKN